MPAEEGARQRNLSVGARGHVVHNSKSMLQQCAMYRCGLTGR